MSKGVWCFIRKRLAFNPFLYLQYFASGEYILPGNTLGFIVAVLARFPSQSLLPENNRLGGNRLNKPGALLKTSHCDDTGFVFSLMIVCNFCVTLVNSLPVMGLFVISR